MNKKEIKNIVAAVSVIYIIWIVNGFYLPVLSEYSKTVFWIYDVFQWVVLPFGILVLLIKKYEMTPSDYGFTDPFFSLRTITLSLAATITFYPATIIVDRLVWELSGQPDNSFAFQNVFPEGFQATVIWLYSAVTAGVIESIFFISIPWLLWSQYQYKKVTVFVLINALVFSIAHWEQGFHAVVAAFSFEVVACIWYLRIRSIWPIIFGHTIIDLIAFS